jgi:hypothetical protein
LAKDVLDELAVHIHPFPLPHFTLKPIAATRPRMV